MTTCSKDLLLRIRQPGALLLLLALLLGGCEQYSLVADDLAWAQKAYADRNLPLAERLLERFLHEEQDPAKRWLAWDLLLKSLNANGQQPRASLECLEAMRDEYDDDGEKMAFILAAMGRNHVLLRHYEDAARSFGAYIELAELTPQARIEGMRRLAASQFALRHFEAGEATLQQCIGLPAPDHDKIGCMLDLADINMARERWEEVADLCQQILDSEPGAKNFGLAAFLRGDALTQMGRLDEALAQFEMARSSYPNKAAVDNHIAHLEKTRNNSKNQND